MRPRGTTTSLLSLMVEIFLSAGDSSRRRCQMSSRSASVAAALRGPSPSPRGRRLRPAESPEPTDSGDAIHFDDEHGACARGRHGTAGVRRQAPSSEAASTSSTAAGTTRRWMSCVTASTAWVTSANSASSVALRRRLRNQPQRDLGDDRQRAFGADEQLRQVVADDVLHRLRSGLNDLSARAARPRAPARSASSFRT